MARAAADITMSHDELKHPIHPGGRRDVHVVGLVVTLEKRLKHATHFGC